MQKEHSSSWKLLFLTLTFLFFVQNNNAQTAEEYYQKALKQLDSLKEYNNQDYSRVIKNLSNATNKDPKFYKAFFLQGQIYEKVRNYAFAIDLYNKTIESNPNYSDAYLARGLISLYDTEKACKDLNRAKELGNENAQIYLNKYCK